MPTFSQLVLGVLATLALLLLCTSVNDLLNRRWGLATLEFFVVGLVLVAVKLEVGL